MRENILIVYYSYSGKTRRIAEESIPTAFINLSLLKIIAMDKCQFYSLPIQSTVV